MKQFFKPIKDVVLILADAKDPKDYLSKMRRREPELAKGWGQIVHPLVVRTPGGSPVGGETIKAHPAHWDKASSAEKGSRLWEELGGENCDYPSEWLSLRLK